MKINKRTRVIVTLTIVSILLCVVGNISFSSILLNYDKFTGDAASALLLFFFIPITFAVVLGTFPLSIVNISMALKNIFIRKEEKLSFNLLIIITNTLIIITTISVFIYFEFTFVYGVRVYSNFINLHVTFQLSQHHL